MAYKTIAVYMDDSKHCRARIDAAAVLARRFDAHLVGIYAAEPIPSPHALQDPWLAERLAARSSAASQRMALAGELFHTRAGEIDSARLEFRDVDIDAVEAITVLVADLIVVGQTDPDVGDELLVRVGGRGIRFAGDGRLWAFTVARNRTRWCDANIAAAHDGSGSNVALNVDHPGWCCYRPQF